MRNIQTLLYLILQVVKKISKLIANHSYFTYLIWWKKKEYILKFKG